MSNMSDREGNYIMSVAERSQIGIVEIMEHPRAPPPPYTVSDPAKLVTVQPIVHQTIIVQQVLQDVPTYFNCPSCHKRILTTVKFVNSHKTHLIAGFVCGLTLWCLVCCLSAIPYMLRTCKTADHYCSNCNYYLGSYSKV